MGVISPKTRITIVKMPTAIPGPIWPNHSVASTVAIEAAAILTRLFPINIVINIFGVSLFSFSKALEPRLSSFVRLSTLAMEIVISAVSDPEKTADRKSKRTSTINSMNRDYLCR